MAAHILTLPQELRDRIYGYYFHPFTFLKQSFKVPMTTHNLGNGCMSSPSLKRAPACRASYRDITKIVVIMEQASTDRDSEVPLVEWPAI